MKAVILAGGQGSRLRPLTCNIPKPLVTLCSKPVIEYTLELLAENGCDSAVITLGYLGERIEKYFGADSFAGVKLTFAYEEKPLGTAGCVRAALDNIDDDFIVISGDAVCDFNLKAAYEYHKKNKADATIIGVTVDDPREYGLIAAADGRVMGFCEKPSYLGCTSDLANTGIYILSPRALDLIPRGKSWDFAKNVFPEMLLNGMQLMCYKADGYWCDIGDMSAYRRCHADMLDGKIRLPLKLSNVRHASYISENAQISGAAEISENSVICDNATVGSGARLNGAIVLSGAYIGENVTLNDCVIGENVRLEHGASVFEGAIIGDDCVIGQSAVICSGVRLWQNKRVDDGETVNHDIRSGAAGVPKFTENGIEGETNSEISPEFMSRLGSAAASISKSGVTVAADDKSCSRALKSAFAAGVAGTGCICYNTESASLPVILHTAELCRSDIIVQITSEAKTSVRFFAGGGLPLTRVQERLLEGALYRGEYKTAGWREFGNVVSVTSADALYLAMLRRQFDFTCGYKLRITGVGDNIRSFAENLGRGSNPLTIRVTPDGARAAAYDENGCVADHTRLMLLGVIAHICRGNDIALPLDFPAVADAIASGYGQRLYRFYAVSNDDSDSRARSIAAKEFFLCDGLYLALHVLQFLSEEKISLRSAVDRLPRFTVKNEFIQINCPPQRILSRLGGEAHEGVTIPHKNGQVRVRSNKRGNGIFIFAESASSETARELCALTEAEIARLIKENESPEL